MRISVAAMALAVLASVSALSGAEPATAGAGGEFSLTAVQPCQLKGTTMIYETIHVKIAESSEPMRKAVVDLYAKLKTTHIIPTGGPVFVFKGIANVGEPMDIEVGLPVVEKTAAPEGTAVRELASVPSVVGIFKGPFSTLSQAYPEFFQQMTQLGKSPAGELRQRTLYFEGENSANNIVLMEMQTAE